jgi:hypothetical protein
MKNKNFILNEEVIRILEMMNIESKKSKLLNPASVNLSLIIGSAKLNNTFDAVKFIVPIIL